jgi:hypothetical protein
VLTTAVASRLGTRAILPAAAIGPQLAEDIPEHEDWEQKRLIHMFNRLAEYRDLAEQAKKSIPADPKKQKPADKKRLAAIDAAIARYDGFFTKVTTADDKGAVPLAQAARLDTMLDDDVSVLRVHVDKAGGSLINSKNIATTFGADPLRVSGGLLVRYTITNPRNGALLAGDVLTCGTALTRVRRVQEWHWLDDAVPGSGRARSGCKGMTANGGQIPEAARPARLTYDFGGVR